VNPFRVKNRSDLEGFLGSKGFVNTGVKTATGEFWKCTRTGKHIQVPLEYQDGMYPEYYLQDMYTAIELIAKGTPLQ
jgi:hypothetical protein